MYQFIVCVINHLFVKWTAVICMYPYFWVCKIAECKIAACSSWLLWSLANIWNNKQSFDFAEELRFPEGQFQNKTKKSIFTSCNVCRYIKWSKECVFLLPPISSLPISFLSLYFPLSPYFTPLPQVCNPKNPSAWDQVLHWKAGGRSRCVWLPGTHSGGDTGRYTHNSGDTYSRVNTQGWYYWWVEVYLVSYFGRNTSALKRSAWNWVEGKGGGRYPGTLSFFDPAPL